MRRNDKAACRNPVLSPEAEEALTRFVGILTGPDEPRRQAAVEQIRHVAVPAVAQRVIALLVAFLGRQNKSECRRAIQSLTGIGKRAIPTLLLTIMRSRSQRIGVHCAETLAAIAPELSLRDRTNLMYDLQIAMRKVKAVNVVQACALALAAVRLVSNAEKEPVLNHE